MLGALVVVVLLGSLSAMTTAGPRVYFAMARDRAFFPAAARIHPRFHTPWVSILAQAVWSSLLVLTNTKDQLAEYTGFAVLLFSAFAVSTLFVLRRRHPDEPRPFRAWGYPVAPAHLRDRCRWRSPWRPIAGRPGPSLWGAVIIAAGVPAYFLFKRTIRRGARRRERTTGSRPARQRVVSSAHSVTSASVPSAAANSRNDAGEPRSRWSATNSAAPAPFSIGPITHR